MAQNNTPPQQQQQLSPPIKKKNSNCRRCLIAVVAALILVLVICIIILILLLTVLKPKQPRTQIQSAKVDGFTSRLTFPKIEFKLNITLELQILVQNENHASFKHGNGKSSLFYKGNQVGDVDIDPGLIPARGSTTVSSRLTLEVDKLADDLTDLIRDVLGGTLVMETRTEIPGRVNFLGIFKKHIKATSECIFTIGFPDMKIQSQECNNKASL